MSTSSHIQTLRTMLRDEKGVILPGAPNALAARIIADLGFRAVYLTGAGLTNMHLGLPDLGFMDLSLVADHVMAIRNVIDLPLIVDIDTGFGNAVNVTHNSRSRASRRKCCSNRGPACAQALRSLRRQGVGAAGRDGGQGAGRGRHAAAGHGHHRTHRCLRRRRF
jgi:hypothetical protein